MDSKTIDILSLLLDNYITAIGDRKMGFIEGCIKELLLKHWEEKPDDI